MIVIDGGQVATHTVVTCRGLRAPELREWSLVAEGPPDARRWSLVYRGASLEHQPVALPLPGAAPVVDPDRVSLDYHSANGGRSVRLSASSEGPSSLDAYVNFELEVNVERDLDRGVEQMNTNGPSPVRCEWAAPLPADGEPEAARASSGEWIIGGGYGWSVDLLRSHGGRRYVMPSVSWGHDVTRDGGPGLLRGRLAWAIEAMPVFAQFEPASTVGVGVLPLVWRWRFAPRRRGWAFAELGFGGLFTGAAVPEGTETANFQTHGAFGVRWTPSRRTALVTAYRFHHISNGNQLTSNPGVNAHVIWIGISRR